MTTTALYIDHWERFKAPPRCWFTNLPLMAPESRGTRLQLLQEATVEHLVPLRRNRWIVNRAPIDEFENLVWSAAFVNNISGNAPLSIKMQIRDYARALVAGNTYLSTKTVERITKFIRDLYASYRVGTSEIWLMNENFASPIKSLPDDETGLRVLRIYNDLVAAERMARASLLTHPNEHAVLITEKNHGVIVVPDEDVVLGPRFKTRAKRIRYTITSRPVNVVPTPPPTFATFGDLAPLAALRLKA